MFYLYASKCSIFPTDRPRGPFVRASRNLVACLSMGDSVLEIMLITADQQLLVYRPVLRRTRGEVACRTVFRYSV